jgi:hypothetical protein
VRVLVAMDVEVADDHLEKLLATGTSEDAELAFFQEIQDKFEGSWIRPAKVTVMQDEAQFTKDTNP